jgi:hypothetical protein
MSCKVIYPLARHNGSVFGNQNNADTCVIQGFIKSVIQHIGSCDDLSLYADKRKSPDSIWVTNDH